MIARYHSAQAPCFTATGSSAHRSSGASGEVGWPAAAVGEAVAGAPSFLCSTTLVASLPSVSSSAAIMAAGLEVGCAVNRGSAAASGERQRAAVCAGGLRHLRQLSSRTCGAFLIQ